MGTPLGLHLRTFPPPLFPPDLFGLLLFLKVDPYSIQQWFQKLLWRPLVAGSDLPMLSLFSRIMWRNSKANVAAEVSQVVLQPEGEVRQDAWGLGVGSRSPTCPFEMQSVSWALTVFR